MFVTPQKVNPTSDNALSEWIIRVFMGAKPHIDFLLGKTELYK